MASAEAGRSGTWGPEVAGLAEAETECGAAGKGQGTGKREQEAGGLNVLPAAWEADNLRSSL